MKRPETRPIEIAALRGVFSGNTARELASKATVRHFSHDDTALLFRIFLKKHYSREVLDPVTAATLVASEGGMDIQDAEAFIGSIMDHPEPVAIGSLVEGLGIMQGRKRLADLWEYLDKPDALKDGMSGAIRKVNEFILGAHQTTGRNIESLTDTLSRAAKRDEQPKVYTPGIGGELDLKWKFRLGSYWVIGGDSGSGKTALVCNLIPNLARQGARVGVISIEMTRDELTYRMAAIEAGVDHERIEDNLMGDVEREAIEYVLAKNRDVYNRVFISDPSGVSADELPGYYNDFVSKFGCDVVVIDYLQRISADSKTGSKEERVSVVSETITALTKSTGVLTIALSVLSRVAAGGGKRKGLDNLKHSGQIGHDAHGVVIITPEEGEGYSETKHATLEAVKNRKGRFFADVIELHGPTQRIRHIPAQ